MDLKEYIRSIPDYPKKGILFRDITTLIKNEKAFEETINQIIKRLNPDIETMEGAACMIACKNMGVPCIQIRSISNYIEERNKSNWKIDFAIENLNSELNKFIKILCLIVIYPAFISFIHTKYIFETMLTKKISN